MTHLTTPYRFVPLSRVVLLPDWAPQVSHDQPFQDGWCGELHLRLNTHSPLCVGGRQDKPSDRAPGRVHFYRTPDGRPAIPGSSLKGMLRSVMEIATFARFRQVEERRLGVRDISNHRNSAFYINAMVKSKVKAGWLTFSDGQWRLRPCRFVRVFQGDLIEHFGIDKEDWDRLSTAEARYERLDGLRTLSFDIESRKKPAVEQAVDLGQGPYEGVLVVTGQPGSAYDKPKAKKREFVFFNPADDDRVVDPDVMADFMFIHGDSNEWAYWRRRLDGLTPGVPVFYHEQEGPSQRVKSLGLAMMYKLAYRHTLHEAIRHTQAAHLETEHEDLPELLFGRLDENDGSGAGNLRGRVNIGLACSETQPDCRWTDLTVLSNPKPTFYPAYIRQPSEGSYKTLMDADAEPAGWKRYPAKPFEPDSIQPPPHNSRCTVQTRLETVPAGTTFTGRLIFHNLRPAELGALLWCLDFGQRDDRRHSLGTGKPYGLGQVSLQLLDAELMANDPEVEPPETDLVLEACRCAFDEWMQKAWSEATDGGTARWDDSEPVHQLLAMADPAEGRGHELKYMQTPRMFMRAKQYGERLGPYGAAGTPMDEPPRHFKPVPSGIAEHTLGDYLQMAQRRRAAAEAQRRAAEAKRTREAEKETLPPQARLLAELEDELSRSEDNLTSTQEKRLARLLNQIHREAGDWESPLRRKLLELAARSRKLGKSKIDSAAKKIIRDYGG